MNRVEKLLLANTVIAILSLAIIYLFDWPIEIIGIIGISWVVISLLEMMAILRKVKYTDWFGTTIEEPIDSMIWRINTLEKQNIELGKQVTKYEKPSINIDTKQPIISDKDIRSKADEKGMRGVICRVVFTITHQKDYSSKNEEVIKELSTRQELWVEIPEELLKKQLELTVKEGKRFYPLCCKVEGFEEWQPL